jgi:hypothetical protein
MEKKNNNMIYKIGYIRDVLGNNYIGLKFDKQQLSLYLKRMKEIVDNEDKYETLVGNQQRRDVREESDYTHHSTIISVMEFNQLYKEHGSKFQDRIDFILSLDISDLTIEGVGRVQKNENEAYFLVLNSPTLDEIRISLGLEPKDFHVTLGFDKKDVFGVRKNMVLKPISKLKKIYELKMEEHGSHTWIYDIENFDQELREAPEDKIELVNVGESTITYNIEHTRIQIGLINDELRVVTKSEIKK